MAEAKGLEGEEDGDVDVAQQLDVAYEALEAAGAKVQVVPSPPMPHKVNWALSADGSTSGMRTPSAMGTTPGGMRTPASGNMHTPTARRDDVNAILTVHGYASTDDALVVDLHNTGLVDLAPVVEFSKAKIFFLHSNAISVLDGLLHCRNLVKLDLAHNQIEELPSPDTMMLLPHLALLYLHNNRIHTWQPVEALAALPALALVTLHDNPVSAHPKYRHYVVNKIPHLKALDTHLVSDEERMSTAQVGLPNFPDAFAAMSPSLAIPPPQYHAAASPDLHLKAMRIELRHLLALHKKRSPTLIVQRVLRAARDRRWVKKRRDLGPWAAVRIQSAARFHRWRVAMLRDIDRFLLDVEPRLVISYQDNERTRAAWLIQIWWKKVKPDPILYRATTTIARAMRRRVAAVRASREWLTKHRAVSIVFDHQHRDIVMAAASMAWRQLHADIRADPERHSERQKAVSATLAQWSKERSAKQRRSRRRGPRSGRRSDVSPPREARTGARVAWNAAPAALSTEETFRQWHLAFSGDYVCPPVRGDKSEALEGNLEFARFFVENRVRRTCVQPFIVPCQAAPPMVNFRRLPSAARYLSTKGEGPTGTREPRRFHLPVSESLRHHDYHRYRVLKRRVPRASAEQRSLFKRECTAQHMHTSRMVGTRGAVLRAARQQTGVDASSGDARRFKRLLRGLHGDEPADSAPATSTSDCDDDDDDDNPLAQESFADATEALQAERAKASAAAKRKRESMNTMLVVTLPSVELLLRTLVRLRTLQYRREGVTRSRLLLPGYFCTTMQGGVLGVGQAVARAAAANAIQAAWRSFWTRRSLSPPLYDRVATFRATVIMQRVFRMRHLRWRLQMLAAVSSLSSSIDSDTLYLEESVYRVLLDSSLWGPDRLEGRQTRDKSGGARLGGHRRDSQQFEAELWDEVGRTEAVAVTHAPRRHPADTWTPRAAPANSPPTEGDGRPSTPGSSPSHPSVDADNRRVRPKSGGRLAGFRAQGTSSVLTRGAEPTPPVARPRAQDAPGHVKPTVLSVGGGNPHDRLPPRPWRQPYMPEHELEVCVVSGQLRLVQPRRPSEKWLGRRVGLPLWLGWGIDWVKAPVARPNRPYSAVTPGMQQQVYKYDNVALLTEGVAIRPIKGKLYNPEHRKRGTSRRALNGSAAGSRDQPFELDPPDWNARGVRLLELQFSCIQEARVRACVLLARTWHAFTRCGATMYAYNQVEAAWRFGKAGMPTGGFSRPAPATFPAPTVPEVDRPSLPTRWALRFAWSDWEVIKLPPHLSPENIEAPSTARQSTGRRSPSPTSTPRRKRRIQINVAKASAATTAAASTGRTDASSGAQPSVAASLPPAHQLYTPRSATGGADGSLGHPQASPLRVPAGQNSRVPQQPSGRAPPRSGITNPRQRRGSFGVQLRGGVPPVTIVRQDGTSMAHARPSARSEHHERPSNAAMPPTHRGGDRGATARQLPWSPHRTGKLENILGVGTGIQSLMHLRELKKATQLALAAKRDAKLQEARERVQKTRIEARMKKHSAEVEKTLRRRKEDAARVKSKLADAQKLDAADSEMEAAAADRAAAVKRRRERQRARRQQQAFSMSFASSQNLVTRHLAAGKRRRQQQQEAAAIEAKRREHDKTKEKRRRYAQLSQRVSAEERRRNAQAMRDKVNQSLEARKQQELDEFARVRARVQHQRDMHRLQRSFRLAATGSGMREALRPGAAGPLELAMLSARHNFMVTEGQPLATGSASADGGGAITSVAGVPVQFSASGRPLLDFDDGHGPPTGIDATHSAARTADGEAPPTRVVIPGQGRVLTAPSDNQGGTAPGASSPTSVASPPSPGPDMWREQKAPVRQRPGSGSTTGGRRASGTGSIGRRRASGAGSTGGRRASGAGSKGGRRASGTGAGFVQPPRRPPPSQRAKSANLARRHRRAVARGGSSRRVRDSASTQQTVSPLVVLEGGITTGGGRTWGELAGVVGRDYDADSGSEYVISGSAMRGLSPAGVNSRYDDATASPQPNRSRSVRATRPKAW